MHRLVIGEFADSGGSFVGKGLGGRVALVGAGDAGMRVGMAVGDGVFGVRLGLAVGANDVGLRLGKLVGWNVSDNVVRIFLVSVAVGG